MKYSHYLSLAYLSIVLCFTGASCSRPKLSDTPSMEYASLVKAYTGGIISESSKVRVELLSGVPGVQSGDPAPSKLFSFSPSLKGSAKWVSPNIVEFVPDQGALKAGQIYKCNFYLNKIIKGVDKRLAKFPFSFMAAGKEAAISIDYVVISKDEPEKAAVVGTVSLSDPLDKEAVRAMISYRYEDKGEEVQVGEGPDPNHIVYWIEGLDRSRSDEKFTVSLKEGDTGFKTGEAANVMIPGIDSPFGIISAHNIGGETPYIEISFSKPLDTAVDLNGLLSLNYVNRFYVQTTENIARIYYDSGDNSSIELVLSDGIRSSEGDRLGKEHKYSFHLDKAKPDIYVPISGTILPNAKELILPFRAICLKAVDLSVIKIYEDNVLMFLQDNDMGGSSELRRAGRLVHKKCIRLDEDPSLNLHEWQDFSVDLSGLFKQEPGAIYRIRLSFNKDYSLYGEYNEGGAVKTANEMKDISGGGITEEEIAMWDIPDTYYYSRDYDWEDYDWRETDNPMHPSYYMNYNYPEYNLTTSNIGLIAKYSDGNKIWVTTSDIISAKPMSGVDLEVYNFQLRLVGKGKTNSSGLSEIEVSGRPFAVIAKKNDATSYLKVTNGDELSTSKFDIGGTVTEKGLKSYIYGERGVWRPGDTLHVTMIIKDKTGALPENHPAVMELYTPQGQFYSKQTCINSKNGFYTFHTATLADDPTGIWNAYFKVGGASFHKSLRIESLKPNRLKINLDFKDKILGAGISAPVTMSANWLTGPAASGLAAKADMTLTRGGSSFEGFEGYKFTDPTSSFTSSESRIIDTRLDGSGKASLSVDMPSAKDAPGMLKANIVCSVEEAGGDASFTTMTIPFSPFSAYVGIRSPKEENKGYLETDTDLIFNVAVVDKNGKRVSGHDLEYRIFKLKWSWWWESRSYELDSYVNGTTSNMVASGKLRSSGSDSKINFRIEYPEWGRYLVYVKDLSSGHATGDIVMIDWPSYRGMSDKSDPDALSMLAFSTDKKTYEAGETATVYIPGSAKGRALISIENSVSVLKQDWVETSEKGDTKYKFKVTEDMAPNFYISISLLQPHKQADNDLPIRIYGIQPVTVNNKASHLNPEISMPDVIHPEETFTVNIKEKNGKPMTYTLAIVDEGLLDITSFKTPDPWSEMNAREALRIRTWDLYDDVIGAFSGRFSPMFSVGGDESSVVNSKKDNRFNPVVKFLGPFTLKSGSNKHKITLPMYIGSVRVMVVAGQNGAFGNAEKAVPVRSPLMVLPTLPRVMGTQEKVVLPVNVFALEDNVRNVTVSVESEGPLKINGSSQMQVAFNGPGDKLIKFNMESKGEGMAKVTVTAKGDGYKAFETINIEVRNPNPVIISSDRAMIGKGESKTFSFAPFKTDEKNSAVLSLSGFPVIDFDGNFSYFKNYSYSCTEQIAAKGISLIYTRELLSETNSAKANEMIPLILQEIYSRQLADGGFAYWPGMVNADTWATSMVGLFITEAADKGFDVNKGVAGNWVKFQNNAVKNYRHSKSKYLDDLDQAFRLHSLALAKKADHASMNRLKESEELTNQARWMLASSYAVCGKKNIAQELINTTDSTFESYSANNFTFGSQLRDKAIALDALVLNDKLPEALTLAQDIAERFNSGYNTTQESAFVSMAMRRLAEKSNTGIIEAEVTGAGDKAESFKSPKSVYSQAVDPSKGKLSVKNVSEGPMFASLLRTYQPEIGESVNASGNGIKLSVSYVNKAGNPVSPENLKQSTDFTAIIKVTHTGLAEDYTNLALTAMIPSGWEIYNERLLGKEAVVSSQNAYNYNDIRDDRNIWYFDLPLGTTKTFKTQLRAAYEGEFYLPSIVCEAMYDPQVYARTASGKAAVSR